MINLLTTIAVILILAAAFTKLFDVFVNEKTKTSIKEKVENFWVDFDDTHPYIIIQVPLIFLSTFYNIFFGKRCFSKKAITRSVLLSFSLLIASLCITGVLTGTHLGMEKLPWEYFDEMIKSEKVLYEVELKTAEKDNKESSLSSLEHSKQRWEYISQFNKPIWRILYSTFFILFVFIINAFVDTISFSISRLMLNEMIQTKSVLLLLSVFFLNAVISICIATFILFASFLLTMPSIAGTVITLVTNLLINYPAWTSIGLFAAAVGTWKLSGGWFIVLAITTIFPSIVFCLVISISILINPMKNKVYKFIKVIILRAIEHDKGIFAFFSIFFTTAGAIIGAIVKLFGS
jgi:hypothetical protein